MLITEVRIKLLEQEEGANERLQAFCSVTFDDQFVVRDLKVIEGSRSAFVAMLSRKLTDRCPECGSKNHLRARFCNECGGKLAEERAERNVDGRVKLHADIAHPINSDCRLYIQAKVLAAFEEERKKLQQATEYAFEPLDEGEQEELVLFIDGQGNPPEADWNDWWRRVSARHD